jgi:hypothetical protein
MEQPSPTTIFDYASPRPWTYHNDGGRDWVEDASGNTILENLGRLDGPLIVACVNEAHACGTETEAVIEDRKRQAAMCAGPDD